MNYATVCSGAEAFGPAWHELGLTPVFHAEIEPHASAVLRHRYPTVPNYGDFTQIATPDGPAPARPVQLLCGGTPCQTYSVAGLREGINSYKGGLTLEFVRLAQRLGAKWLLWENVPGVLSSDGGRAFGTFLGTLAECGYGFAYRVLDLQHFGAPQRRKRVFLVAHSGGDWQSCAAVLFERESLRGNPAPGRETGQEVTGTLSSRPNAGGGLGTDFDCAGGLVAEYAGNAEGATGLPFLTVSNIGKMVNNQTPLLTVTAQPLCIAFTTEQTPKASMDKAFTITQGSPSGGGHPQCVSVPPAAVRRLTPVECERLMGWADDWTRYGINAKGKPYELADGPRYRICGNGWGQPVVSWIAARILEVESLTS